MLLLLFSGSRNRNPISVTEITGRRTKYLHFTSSLESSLTRTTDCWITSWPLKFILTWGQLRAQGAAPALLISISRTGNSNSVLIHNVLSASQVKLIHLKFASFGTWSSSEGGMLKSGDNFSRILSSQLFVITVEHLKKWPKTLH